MNLFLTLSDAEVPNVSLASNGKELEEMDVSGYIFLRGWESA